MNISSDTILHIVIGIAGGAIMVTIAVVGWLLRRAIRGVDDNLTLLNGRLDGITSVLSDHNSRLVRVETLLRINVPADPPAAHAATQKVP